jgi:hypothetical protein
MQGNASWVMSAMVRISGLSRTLCDFRVGPIPDKLHCSKQARYSITPLARPSYGFGSVRPSALAVLKIDDEFDLRNLLDRQIKWFLALEIRPV